MTNPMVDSLAKPGAFDVLYPVKSTLIVNIEIYKNKVINSK